MRASARLLSSFAFALATIAVPVGFGCVGDDPGVGVDTPDTGTNDGTSSDGPNTEDAGSSTDSADPDSGPPPTGDFVWELHAQRLGQAAEGATVATNAAGDIAVAAQLNGATSIEGVSVPDPGGAGLVVFKMNAAKAVAWAKSYPLNTVRDVAIDQAGNVYVVGDFFGNKSFGTAPTIVLNPANTGAYSAYVVKLRTADGTPDWGNTISRSNGAGNLADESYGTSVAVRGNDVVIGSYFSGNIGFEKDQTVEYRKSIGNYDGLVQVLNPASGKTLWVKHLAGTQREDVNGVAFDSVGNVLVAGGYGSPTLSIEGGPPTFTNPQALRGFIVRFNAIDPHGITLAKDWGGATGADTANVHHVIDLQNKDKELTLCGAYRGTVNLGLGNVGSKGMNDAFVMRLDGAGATKWVETFGGTLDDDCRDIATNGSNHTLIAGTYRSSSVVVSGRSITDPASGKLGGYVAKLGTAGGGQWAYGHPSADGTIVVESARFLPTGDVVYSGAFAGTVNLGGGNVQSANNGTQTSLFVVRRKP